jgi:uncharacterized protein
MTLSLSSGTSWCRTRTEWRADRRVPFVHIPAVSKPLDLRRLLSLVADQYLLHLGGIHGVSHWARVLENGRRLAPLTGADRAVVELFAIFHDACRHNDGRDPDHGPRAAELVRSAAAMIDLDAADLALLAEACDCHTRGPRRGAPITVLTCLDADRLDIPRVGRRVDGRLLFSDAARDPSMVSWSTTRAAARHVPELCRAEWGWDTASAVWETGARS